MEVGESQAGEMGMVVRKGERGAWWRVSVYRGGLARAGLCSEWSRRRGISSQGAVRAVVERRRRVSRWQSRAEARRGRRAGSQEAALAWGRQRGEGEERAAAESWRRRLWRTRAPKQVMESREVSRRWRRT